MERGAGFSRCGAYRYWLTRQWADGPDLVFIGLNPSTADAQRDDATLRRIINFAAGWGYGAVTVVNLFAWRARHPGDLKHARDPVGSRNNYWLQKLALANGPVVAAWGNHGVFLGRQQTVLAKLSNPLCLGITRKGHPRHPLYAPKSSTLSAFPLRH